MEPDRRDVTTLIDRIAQHEQVYIDTVRKEMGRYPAMQGRFPPYLNGPFQIDVCIAGDGVVVRRVRSSHDSFRFFDEPNSTLREVTHFTDDQWHMFESRIEAQRGELGGTGYALQIRLTDMPNARLERNDGTNQSLLVSMFITNTFDLQNWTAPLAQAEASSDVNTFVAANLLDMTDDTIMQYPDRVKNAVYSRYANIIQRFRSLLDVASSESPLQKYLEANPSLLALDVGKTHPQFRLGEEYVADFVLERADQRYVFVEIESSVHALYTQSRNPKNRKPSAALEHAIQQVEDWQSWIARNLRYLDDKLPGIGLVEYWVVIGRKPEDRTERRKLMHKQQNLHGIRILTYDDLLEQAENQLRNLQSH